MSLSNCNKQTQVITTLVSDGWDMLNVMIVLNQIKGCTTTGLDGVTRDPALASMARDDPPTSSTASSMAAVLLAAWRPQCAVSGIGI